ncbi:MAG: hypothetical protein VX938_10295 [Myxococcota bacterium]|nr:hypothetical protein [Myxococcota bacterium]
MNRLLNGLFLLVVVPGLGACGQQGEPWAALEVQRCVDQAVVASFDVKEKDRSKALAVQAADMAGDNVGLAAAAHLAAGWAELRRGEQELGLRFVRKALDGLQPSKATNALALWVARTHHQASRGDEALEILKAWSARLDPEVHAHLMRPVKMLRKQVESFQVPVGGQPPSIDLEDLIKR